MNLNNYIKKIEKSFEKYSNKIKTSFANIINNKNVFIILFNDNTEDIYGDIQFYGDLLKLKNKNINYVISIEKNNSVIIAFVIYDDSKIITEKDNNITDEKFFDIIEEKFPEYKYHLSKEGYYISDDPDF